MSMKRAEIISVIESLARHQGFYGRLLQGLSALNEDEREAVLADLEVQQFKDAVDLILFFET